MSAMIWFTFGLITIIITAYLSITNEESVQEVYQDDGVNHEAVEELYDALHEAEIRNQNSNVEAIRHAIMLEESGYKITNDDTN